MSRKKMDKPKRPRSSHDDIRKFVLETVEKQSTGIAKLVSKRFHINREAASKHLRRMIADRLLEETGSTKSRRYTLAVLLESRHEYPIRPELKEDEVWMEAVAPVIGEQSENVSDIWRYCFTEIFNNAIEHSGGTAITVHVSKTALNVALTVSDNGIGIFKKIQQAFHLSDERHAVLELAKGKTTTDPSKHSGEGIFFVSRMVDRFDISANNIFLSHVYGEKGTWFIAHVYGEKGTLFIAQDKSEKGTFVQMKLNNHTTRKMEQIYNQFASEANDYAFSKTVVPVQLAQYGDDKLVSRSQAKRLLDRIDRFKTVDLDFEGVSTIGQAFADEIFRVFANEHPEIKLTVKNENTEVKRMISRARAES